MPRPAIHESSHSEVFLKIGIPRKYTKYLKNTSEQVDFRRVAGCKSAVSQNLKPSHVFFKKLANILSS